MKQMNKILIANRSEIAVRIIRSAKKYGIETLAIYSPSDSASLHVTMADEAYQLKSDVLQESYLDIDQIIQIAIKAQADAIHPGYGFLSENPLFVKACKKNSIRFIGPDEDIMILMGNKIKAREFVEGLGIPVPKGITGTVDAILEQSAELDYPVLVKAAAGGGGKGMRIIMSEDQLQEAIESTSREALSYFNDATVYVEKYLERPRHIEVQLLADHHGNVVHLFERECSVQRRYQKIIEESPAPGLNPELQKKLCNAAVRIAKASRYKNAGTIEFLVDKDENFYFLEMNTRIQVEHPVTEMVTGFDLVLEQIKIADNRAFSFKQSDIQQKGHAIECRIYAENPEDNFIPSPGQLLAYQESHGQGIRVDSAITGPVSISPNYDPMVAKLITFDENRELARSKMLNALINYQYQGIPGNISYLKSLILHPDYIENRIYTKFCEDHHDEILNELSKGRRSIPKELVALFLALITISNKDKDKSKSVWKRIGYWREIPGLSVLMDDQEFYFDLGLLNQGKIYCNKNEFIIEDIHLEGSRFSVKINKKDYSLSYYINSDGFSWISFDGFNFKLERKDYLPSSPIRSG